MYINQIDELIGIIIDDFFNTVILKDKVFKKIIKEENFVKYQLEINKLLSNYINTINIDDIKKIVNNDENVLKIIDIIKRYLAYYVFLTIGYHQSKGQDTFVNNIIEFAKNQGTFNFKISDFFNSENNARLIKFYNIVKNTTILLELDKSKLQIIAKKTEFKDTVEFLNSQNKSVRETFKLENVEGKKEFQAHNIIKTIIFIELYLKTEKKDVHSILMSVEKEQGEYTFIEIIVPKTFHVDYNSIENILTESEMKQGYATTVFDFINENEDVLRKIELLPEEKINELIKNKIIVPVVDDFLLYHKDSEKYERGSYIEQAKKKKEDTKIRYIVNKIDSISDYYSSSIKSNPSLKKDVEKYFYVPLSDRKAILINDIEEIKIINKLHNQGKKSIENNEFYNDLMSFRQYPYVNFKDFKDYGFTIQPNKTVTIARQSSFENQRKSNHNLQIRVGSKNQYIDIVGVIIPNRSNDLECEKTKSIMNIRDLKDDEKYKNGYYATLQYLKKTLEKKNIKPVYWKFNHKTDNVQFDSYQQLNKLNESESIKLTLSKLYDDILNILYSNILEKLESYKNLSIYDARKIVERYEKKFIKIPSSVKLRNTLEKAVYYDHSVKVERTYDKKEDVFGGLFEDTVKLPEFKQIKKDDMSKIQIEQDFIFETDVEEEKTDAEKANAICQHFLSWDNLMAIRKKHPNKYSDQLYEFINQYVLENNEKEYVCKSCSTQLNIKKYITDGYYDRKTDKFLTFTMPLTVFLEDIPEYEKYRTTIRNIDKLIEKISSVSSIPYYVGAVTSVKSRRKPLVKNVIDILLIHNKIINKYYKQRHEKIQEKYGISKNLTNLFVFELDNSVFVYSSKDKDYYKPIKHNNILIYSMFMIVNELTDSQILFMNNDKTCNFHWFDKYGHYYFDNLKIIVNDNGDTESIKKYPVLCYVVFYMACLITKYKMWFFESKDNTITKKKLIPIINRSVINTFVDVVNSILEVNRKKNKDYTYTLICNRFFVQMNNLFRNREIIKRLRTSDREKISAIVHSKKFIMTKLKPIELPEKFKLCKLHVRKFPKCPFTRYLPKPKDYSKVKHFTFNSYTNCLEGTFHDWKASDGGFICHKCGKMLDEIRNTEIENKTIYENLRKIKLRHLAEKYCVSGELHKFTFNSKIQKSVCIKCDYYDGKKLTDKQYAEMEKNIHEKREKHIRKIKPKLEFTRKKFDSVESIKSIVNKGGLTTVLNQFIDLIQSNVGKDVILDNETVLLNKDSYIINHTPKGQLLDKSIIITDRNKILYRKQHPYFKRDVLYYTNTKNVRTDVFYDASSHILLGYKEINKNFVDLPNSSRYMITRESVRNRVSMLGYTSRFISIDKTIKEMRENYPTRKDSTIIRDVVSDINRQRIDILKKTITDFQRYIYRLIYNYEEVEPEVESVTEPTRDNFMKKYYKKLTKIKVKDSNGKNKVFRNWDEFNKSVHFKLPEDTVINISADDSTVSSNELKRLDNSGNIVLYYIVQELIKLINYNHSKFTRVTLIHFMLDTINSVYKYYNTDILYRKHDIRRFTYLLSTDRFIYDTEEQFIFSKPEGFYGEYTDIDDKVDEEQVEANYDNEQEQDAIDIDQDIDPETGPDEEEMILNPDNFEPDV